MQQITKVNLKAIKKCDQIWDEMKPIPGGRQCQLCQKKITDFREKSLKEIAEIHVYSDEPVCGIYTEHQLRNEENPIPIESKPWWRSIKGTYLSLASFLLTLSTSAQDSRAVKKPIIEQSPFDYQNDVHEDDLQVKHYLISGIVYNEMGYGLEYANLVIKINSKVLLSVTSNKHGYFELDITSILHQLPTQFEIIVFNIGKPQRKISLNKNQFKNSDKYNNIRQIKTNILIYSQELIEVVDDEPFTESFAVKTIPVKNKKPKDDEVKKVNWLKRIWVSFKSLFSK